MRRVAAVLVLALAACASRRMEAEQGRDGVRFAWSAFDPGPGAAELAYEVRVWKAETLLPREEVLASPSVAGTEWTGAALPSGDYVWSVRAVYLRDGRRCASPWFGGVRTGLVPQRGFAALRVE